MEEVIRETDIMKIGVVVLTETKKKGAGSETYGNYIHLCSGVKKYERAKTGVSIFINKIWKGSIKNWESIYERISKLDMTIWLYKLTIIGTYAPNENNGTTVRVEYFANLNEEIVKYGSGRQLVLMGNTNGRTGRKTGDTVVENFEEDLANDNSERSI